MEIMSQKLFRRSTPYFFGSSPSPVLSFEMSAFSEEEIDADLFQLIQKVFFSSRTYKRLQIDQYDLQNTYFSCILNNPKIVRVGNLLSGIKFDVNCNSPFAFKFPKTVVYNYTVPVVDNTITFNNDSDDTGGYLYPSTIQTCNSFGGDISITNLDDSNRVSLLTGLLPNEIITIDSSLQTISSSTGLKRLSLFNKKFLRLVPGLNRLRIQGATSQFSMTTQSVSKKIGG
jgi:phage-related protein